MLRWERSDQCDGYTSAKENDQVSGQVLVSVVRPTLPAAAEK
jgi:hypothetical protein